MVRDTPTSQYTSTNQICNSYLKEYRGYAPDSIPILETRLEVKVTVTQKWNGTLFHPKMHSHAEFGIPASNYKRYALDTIILKTRSEVKFQVTVTRIWYMPLRHLKMHSYTKFGIPNSESIGDMHQT